LGIWVACGRSAGWRSLCALTWAALLVHPGAWASGTPAGTLIPNSATLQYVYKGKAETSVAVAPAVVVAEVINAVLSWQDLAPVPVMAGDAARVLTFVLTNTGNGTETFRIGRSNTVPGDVFHPVTSPIGAIYLESGAEPGLQTSGRNADFLYLPGGNDPTLAADASQVLYVPSDIPGTTGQGARGSVSLEARSTTPGVAGAAPGTAVSVGTPLPGQSAPPVAVVGASRGQGAAVGGYMVHGVLVSLDKSVANRRDPKGGNQVMPGTELTYRIVLTVNGTGTVQNLTFSDPLPGSLTYLPGSLVVDGVARSDAADGDQAGFAAGVVSASFGDIAAPAVRTIEFKALIN
jgi:uncharacterized repeat protein (TIGR01451 family)